MNNTFWTQVKHRNDNILHQGFNYHDGNILKKTLSNVLYLDSKRAAILDYYSGVLEWLVDYIKMIKKTYNWTLEKDYINFN